MGQEGSGECACRRETTEWCKGRLVMLRGGWTMLLPRSEIVGLVEQLNFTLINLIFFIKIFRIAKAFLYLINRITCNKIL